MAAQHEFVRRQRVLSEFGDFVLDHDDLDEILNEACRLIVEALDVNLAKVIEIKRRSDRASFAQASASSPASSATNASA